MRGIALAIIVAGSDIAYWHAKDKMTKETRKFNALINSILFVAALICICAGL